MTDLNGFPLCKSEVKQISQMRVAVFLLVGFCLVHWIQKLFSTFLRFLPLIFAFHLYFNNDGTKKLKLNFLVNLTKWIQN